MTMHVNEKKEIIQSKIATFTEYYIFMFFRNYLNFIIEELKDPVR